MNKITKEILIEEGFEYDDNLSKWILNNNNSIVAPEIYWDKNGIFIDCKMYPGLSLNNVDSKRYLKTIDELETCYCESYIDKELEIQDRQIKSTNPWPRFRKDLLY